MINHTKLKETDEDAYINVVSDLQTPLEAIIVETMPDILEAKDRLEIESDSIHEEEELDNPTITKIKAFECNDGLRNYISTLNGTTDGGYDELYSLERKKKLISKNSIKHFFFFPKPELNGYILNYAIK